MIANTIVTLSALFIGGLRSWEILVIVLVILLLFGGKKIPELMRGVGKGIRSFKEGLKEVNDEINAENSESGEASGSEKK